MYCNQPWEILQSAWEVVAGIGGCREVLRGPAQSGRYATTWDGRDPAGALLAPGLYVLRLEVETDGGTRGRERIVSLVY